MWGWIYSFFRVRCMSDFLEFSIVLIITPATRSGQAVW